MTKPPEPKPLLEADEVSLHVPTVLPGEKRILISSADLVRNFYLPKQERKVVTLLSGISLKLQPGDRLGLVGANGAGKSTLLRLLAGIYTPSSGKLVVRGATQGLFEVSLGMHPEATGRENIYLRGLHMGLQLSQIRQLVPEVLEFSELSDHIDKPFITYSSGMRLRLAIAVSTMIEPDILLLDEWIGAGDAQFNKKVKARMMSLVEKSRALVIATHNEELMESLCSHAMVLIDGKSAYYGKVDDALKFYSARKRKSV